MRADRQSARGAPAWLLGLTLALAGCQSPGSLRADAFEALGGLPGLRAVAIELVERAAEDARIGHFFAEVDLQHVAERLAEQFCAELDGPCAYTGMPMAEAHFALDIDEADFNRLVEILLQVMDRRKLPEWAQNQLIQRLALMRGEIIHK
jgi:hemoglobin